MPRVLIVDDNAQNLHLLDALLKGHGYEVVQACDGAQALEEARRQPPDLIIADLLMPAMDGYALCRRCKQDERLKRIPFIVYTATYIGKADEALALSLGADKFLVKPVEPDEFMRAIEQTLAAPRKSRRPTTAKSVEEEDYLRQYNEVLVSRLEHKVEELQKANLALERSHERYKTLVESLTAYIYTVRIESGRAIETVHGAGSVAVTGYTPEDYRADPQLWLNMVHPDDRAAVAARAQGLLTDQPAGSFEHRIIHKSGEIRWIRNTPVLHHDEHGQYQGYDGLVQDVTEQRRLAEQLLQAQKMEAVGLLAGGIAHDFRNQLTVIMGYGEMLVRRGLVKGKGLECVQLILKAANRSAELSNQLLAFSRQQELRPEVVNVNNVIAGLPKSLGRLVGEDVHLSIIPSAYLGNVRIDPGQFEQALVNLVVNARDAMPQGGQVRIETSNASLDEDFVRQHVGSSPGPHVVVSVADTGAGMDEGTLKRCFEPFFTTKPVGQGTGLGLSMVYGFVKQSSGYVSVQSKPGRGSTFQLYLPQVQDEAGLAPGACNVPDRLPHGNETILLVEDEEDVRQLVSHTLHECGYAVLEAASAEDALPLSNRHEGTIDLLVSDVVMPGMNGPELAAQILLRRPGTPVLYLSGYAGKALATHGVIPAEVNLLRKPVSARSLARTVRKLLRDKRRNACPLLDNLNR